MANSEVHRQFYLESAGVRMWYAKRPLPGAAPSPEFWFPEEEVNERVATKDVEAGQAMPSKPVPAMNPGRQVARRSVDLQALMASSDSTTKPEPDQKQAPSAGASELLGISESLTEGQISAVEKAPSLELAVESAPVQAHLCFWSTDRFLLVSQWSEEASERLQESLAKNVLKALGETVIGSRRNLHWPVFRSPRIPGNSNRDFQNVLTRVVGADGEKNVILLGVLMGESENQRPTVLSPLLGSCTLDFPYSLAELAATPGCKRDLWNSLNSGFAG